MKRFLTLACCLGIFLTASWESLGEGTDLKNAWNRYYRTLDQLRQEVENTERFADPDNRAMAYYGILEAQAMVYNWVIAPRLDNPRIFSNTNWNTYLFTLGQNNPDSKHAMFTLNGRQSYRLKGRVGELDVAALKVYDDMLGQPDTKDIGDYDVTRYADGDGNFELIFSAEQHPGNWIRIDGDSKYNFVLLRRYVGDWFDDLGELHLERIGEAQASPDVSEQELVERLDRATHLMAFFVRGWNVGFHDSYIKLVGRNDFAVFGGASLAESTGSKLTTYALGIFDCGQDEAIIIEVEVPEAAYWSFQLGDVWAKPLNFMANQTDVNHERAVVDVDGKVRVVISHRDPGVPNWLDAMDHKELLVAIRIFKGEGTFTKPVIRRTKFDELSSALPATTPAVTPEERQKALLHRYRGLARMWDSEPAPSTRVGTDD